MKKYLLSLLLSFSVISFQQGYGDEGDVCIPSAGYETPVYTSAELLGFLSEVPQLVQEVEDSVANGTFYFSPLFTFPYTDWYDESLERGLVELAVIRGILDANNLKHMYLGSYTGNIDEQTAQTLCGPETLVARTVDGSCNKLEDPLAGKIGTRFGRNVLTLFFPTPDGGFVKAVDAETDTLLIPNPRDVSLNLLKRRGQVDTIPFLNLWANAWTQFMIHDWFDHGPSDSSRPLEIPLAEDDPIRLETGQKSIVVGSTPADESRLPQEALLPATFNNYVTHWWDGSQVYGSDQATADRLRTFVDGKLKLTEEGFLPINSQGFGDSGFSRNWWVGLEMLHNLFVQEHNSIAEMLSEAYPDMDDQELYDKARLINSALMVKIHTVEWTPAILPNQGLDVAMNANWYGLERFVTDPVQKVILDATVQYAIANGIFSAKTIIPIIYGIVGNEVDDKGVSFSMTEEFAAIYRMHQLLPDKIGLYDLSGKFKKNIQALDSTNAGARNLVDNISRDELAYSFGIDHPGLLQLRNYPKFMTELEVPPFGHKIDLAAIDILRDRERGLPRYNKFRLLLNLPPIPSIDELTPDVQLRKALKKTYPGGINQVDLFVGVMAESVRPNCFGFGETLFQTFILMASRRLQADRFYTDDYRPEIYTQEGLDWVAENSFKSVLIRHYPNLAETLENVQNAFKPWDDTPPDEA
ncbi:MAG: peroxidase [Chlamydiia bacterium]|nr:peroxidase [Chlamydiia bacterium]